MIAPIMYQPSSVKVSDSMPMQSAGLSRLFCAAVVNQQFCEMLLSNPDEALRRGYLGETFMLTKVERELITSIRARSLADLAREINRFLVVS